MFYVVTIGLMIYAVHYVSESGRKIYKDNFTVSIFLEKKVVDDSVVCFDVC